jgi:hypothetical protein
LRHGELTHPYHTTGFRRLLTKALNDKRIRVFCKRDKNIVYYVFGIKSVCFALKCKSVPSPVIMAGIFRFPPDGSDLLDEFARYGNSVVPVEFGGDLFNGIPLALFGIVIAVENIRFDLIEIGGSYQGMAGLGVHPPKLSFEPIGLAPELAEKGKVINRASVEGLRQEPLSFHFI